MISIQAAWALFYLMRYPHKLEDASARYAPETEIQETEELVHYVRIKEDESISSNRWVQSGTDDRLAYASIRITRSFRIYLGGEELKLRPMAKSVLLLFLRHPEGIVLKDIYDYREELSALYRQVSRVSNPADSETHIARVLDLFTNELNVNISRVNAAVAAMVERSQEPLYRVDGKAGMPKHIRLSRSQVVWE